LRLPRIESSKPKKSEADYQSYLKNTIMLNIPGTEVIKRNPFNDQGAPDLLILYNDKYATLEVKKSKNAPHRPNQDDRVNEYSNKAFGAFIYPENEREVINKLKKYFK
jgi:hypothetical protein